MSLPINQAWSACFAEAMLKLLFLVFFLFACRSILAYWPQLRMPVMRMCWHFSLVSSARALFQAGMRFLRRAADFGCLLLLGGAGCNGGDASTLGCMLA
jgi:hypothetical protein